MATTAYTTAKAAVARSISNDEVAVLALDESLAASERVEAALEALKAFGLEDHDDATDDAGQVVRAWGTHEGKEWTVRTIDGTLSDVRYVR
jgi:hypothetical protein